MLSFTLQRASFDNKNVGTGQAGQRDRDRDQRRADAGNYMFDRTTASTTADITARALTVSAAGMNKVYDGTTTATVTLSDDRVSGDVLTDGYTSATFADKNVGTGKTVSVTGISISGTDADELHVQYDGVDDGRHHGASVDGERDGNEQGLRRDDDGDGDAVG